MEFIGKDPSAVRLAEKMDELLMDEEAPVLGYAASVIKNGHIYYERQGGYRTYQENCPEKCLPVDRDTRFRIASVSKMFTAVAVMQSAEKGLVDLDGDISEYLGFRLRNPHFPDSVITPRLLMAHYGSIRDGSVYSFPFDVPIRECFLPGGRYYAGGEHFAAPDGIHDMSPGHYYQYSNLNYGILGTVIERMSGQRFDRYMREHVLLPMGIRASFNVGDFTREEIADVAALYERGKDQPWKATVDDYGGKLQSADTAMICNPDLEAEHYVQNIEKYKIGTNGTIFSPQGGLHISAHELAVFALMLLSGGTAQNGNMILTPASVQELMKPVWHYEPELDNRDPEDGTFAYGAGLQIISPGLGGDHAVKGAEDLVLYGHTGSAYGLISACYIDPAKKTGFSYAFNGTCVLHGTYRGIYSKRSRWHERMMTAIYDYLYK